MFVDLVPGKAITMSSYPGVLMSGDDYYLISSVFLFVDVVPGKAITMSSYPGMLMSGDDYYLISSGLVWSTLC